MTTLQSLLPIPHVLAASNFFTESGVAAAILLAITGMVLQWRLPRHRMSVEERAKDGDMTEDEARRQIRFYRICATLVTFLGILVLILVLVDLE